MSIGGKIRTPLARVRGLGASKSGTQEFWHMRVTAVALVPLTLGFVLIVVVLLGRNHAAVVQILGSPLVAMLMLLFIVTNGYHMWLGMQEIIVDYVHEDFWKVVALMANMFFCFATALACIFAILKLSFGV
jgi:succinate dehydrogenase / fumarate reductase, membrane anchor subunit